MVATTHTPKVPLNVLAQDTTAKGRLPTPVLIYLVTVVVPIGFRLGPIYMTSLRLFLIALIVPLTIRLLMGKYGKVFITDVLFVLYILWTAISLGVNNPDRMVEQVGSTGIEFWGGYVIGRVYITTPAVFFALCRALILIIICTIPFALYETLTGYSPILGFLRKLPGLISLTDVTADRRLGLERVQSVFAHPIHYGLFCSVGFSLSLVALKGAVSDTRRFVTSYAVFAAGFLALSSGALTALAMQLGMIIWVTMFRGFKGRWWLLVGLFALAYVTVDLLSNRSPLKVFLSYATFSAHNAYWRSIIFDWGLANLIGSAEKGIVGSPIVGIGMNNWIRPWYMVSGSFDNFWLLIAMRYGIPGFLLLTIGYTIAIVRIMRRNFEGYEQLTYIRRAWVFTFLGLTFTLCTVHVWSNIFSFVFFMFGAGMWLITIIPDADEEPTDIPEEQPTKTNQIRYSRFPRKPEPARHLLYRS